MPSSAWAFDSLSTAKSRQDHAHGKPGTILSEFSEVTVKEVMHGKQERDTVPAPGTCSAVRFPPQHSASRHYTDLEGWL